MKELRYLEDVVTLALDEDACVGCGRCAEVCPHGVFELAHRRARVVDRGGCMECGACALNCPPSAITVTPGVGCATAIIQGWLPWSRPDSGCC